MIPIHRDVRPACRRQVRYHVLDSDTSEQVVEIMINYNFLTL
jgi:hypothetical protein